MAFKYIIGLSFVLTHSCTPAQEIQNNDSNLSRAIVEVVQENHLSPKSLDDELSKQLFYSYLKELDPEKKIFSAEEVVELKSDELNLDDELRISSLNFFNKSIETFIAALERAEEHANICLENDIDIFKKESLESDYDKLSFLSDEELRSRWKLIVKKQFNKELYILEITASNLNSQDQRIKALEKTMAFFDAYFSELKSLSNDELLQIYLNAYLSCNDYQSSYLSPKDKAEWDNNFNRTFVGIGISFEATTDYPVITNVLFDGPAWNTNKIRKGDILMKVSNSENELVDVAGLPLQTILDLLKGEAGTQVRIRIKDAKDIISDINIERAKVDMTLATAFQIEDHLNNFKLGYLYLPRFYTGDEGCSVHVLRELRKFNENKIEGIIIDLRDNQGGSAREAIEMIGYFLEGGVVMQTIYANGNHNIYEDEDTNSQFSRKIVVLVNESSSSASELFAGTLQDYSRAIIVGSQTYGKGTVQRFYELQDENSSSEFGEVKLSIARFYTGNGRSTQYHGITPDIILPSENGYSKTGERAIPNTLSFENLAPDLSRINENHRESLNQLIALSEQRQSENAYFQEVENNARLKAENEDQTLIDLNYESFKQNSLKSKTKTPNYQSTVNLLVSSLDSSDNAPSKTEFWRSKIEQDEYIYESFLILNDYLEMKL